MTSKLLHEFTVYLTGAKPNNCCLPLYLLVANISVQPWKLLLKMGTVFPGRIQLHHVIPRALPLGATVL